MLITSPKNPRIKLVLDLRDRRERDRTGLTRVEGYEEIGFALKSGARPQQLLFCPALFGHEGQVALVDEAQRAGAEILELSQSAFERVAYREGADGWLAVFPTPQRPLANVFPRDPAFVLVADAVEKPGNLGAMLRTAEAAGVDALIAADPVTDWGNPNLIRASKGAVFGIQVAAADSPDTVAWLRARGVRIVVAALPGQTLYTEADLSGPVAVVVGAEKQGVSAIWLDGADLVVRIPMFGRVDSLNVATSAALLVYEVVRQRRKP